MASNANAPGANRGAAAFVFADESQSSRAEPLGNGIRARHFRGLVRKLHCRGPRPMGELLLEVAGDHARLIARLERYAAIDEAVGAAFAADDWVDFSPRLVAP